MRLFTILKFSFLSVLALQSSGVSIAGDAEWHQSA